MSKYILAVDPGITKMGYCVVTSDTYEMIEFETINLVPGKKAPSQEQRLWQIFNKLDELFYRYQPELFLTEFQFDGVLLKFMGVAGVIAGKWETEIRYIPAASWKKWGVGHGKAGKLDVQHVVKKIYPELQKASEHVCDSTGFVLAHKNFPDIGKK